MPYMNSADMEEAREDSQYSGNVIQELMDCITELEDRILTLALELQTLQTQNHILREFLNAKSQVVPN